MEQDWILACLPALKAVNFFVFHKTVWFGYANRAISHSDFNLPDSEIYDFWQHYLQRIGLAPKFAASKRSVCSAITKRQKLKWRYMEASCIIR